MQARIFRGKSPRTNFQVTEEHEPFTVLNFGHHIPEHAADLDDTGRLWEFLTNPHSPCKNVVLISTAPGSLSPAHLDEFWQHVHGSGSDAGRSPTETLPDVEIAREENAFRHFVEVVRNIDRFVIAALQGECDFSFLGAALACDYRIAAEDTVFVNRFFESETTPGVLPWFLARFVGHALAADILLEGRSLSAQEAYDLKLVNQLAPLDRLDRVALNTARRFARLPSRSLLPLKRSIVACAEKLDAYLEQIGAGFQPVKAPPAAKRW